MASQKVVAVVISTIGRDYTLKTLPAMARNISSSAKKAGVKPVFIIVDSSEGGLPAQTIKGMRSSREEIKVIAAKGMGANQGWEHGLKAGAKRGPAAMFIFCDDFVPEAKQFDRLVKPFLEGRADFVTGAWKPYGRNILSFPKPQYLNEMWISRLMSYANPHFDAHSFRGNPFLENPQAYQAYVGIYGMTPHALRKITAFMGRTFKDSSPEVKQKIATWGLEPMRVLAALATGLRTQNVEVSARRFEHQSPSGKVMGRFIDSRLAQFNAGTASIREFLLRTNQMQKLPDFDKTASLISGRIAGMKKSRAEVVNRKGRRRAVYGALKGKRHGR